MFTYQKSKYKPINTSKYKGNSTNIICRSSWERKFCIWCDYTESVIEWQSEEFFIPYKHPIDGKIHRYFPDFLIRIKNKNNIIETWVIEIKPMNQTKQPKKQKRLTKRYLNEVKTYAINRYKWDYALEWCKNRNYKFVIFTERELNIQ